MKCNQWKKVKLKDITTDGRGHYGIGASAVEYQENLYTYLRITDITDDGRIIKEGLMSVDDQDAKNYLLKQNDIVFARTGNSTGRSYFYDKRDGDLVFAGFLIKFNLDSDKVNPKYIKLYTLTDQYRNWVNSFATGSTRKNINAKIYGDMEINLPPRNYQDYVVNLIDPFNEKIEINNEINKKLEEMAQAIFKHWFVDFEFPNENGEPYKSSGGEMVESELGMIPKGWKIGSINDLGTIVSGGTPSKKKEEYYTEHGIPWITPKDLSLNKNRFISRGTIDITEEGLKNSSAKLMPKGTVLFSSRAPIGYIAIAKNEVSTNQGFKSIIPKNNIGSEFVYQFLKMNKEIIESRASGSTFKEISGGELKKIPAIIPSNNIIYRYNLITIKISSFIKNNEEELEKLRTIRDTLLPKLMSGEIRVPVEEEK
ncbi:restriction endonuclease subunit S [Caldibacillus thermoamylovorans]|uniref:restriction endonuclease subunit S n=1 Tax=Caldibacillus thermoamylovorans TaxID=35841 RepID=UPI0022E09E64|nr:restriction endonuclease subunit S [Caldibacillus thermoamylovorans]